MSRMYPVTRWLGLISIVLTASCAEPVPDMPTWFDDVQPIILDNCARCHGPVPADDRIKSFRLDRFVEGDDATLDAWDYRDEIIHQAVERAAPAMPPTYALTDRQREILARWVEAGAPKGDRDNAMPDARVVAPDPMPGAVDQTLELEVTASDPDSDALVLSIGVRDQDSGGTQLVATGLGTGLHALAVDTGQVASGATIDVFAIVDDGFSDDPSENQHEVLLASGVHVDHGARGSAPVVALLAPNGGQTLLGPTTVWWSASDPDTGDTLTIDLDLLRVATDGTSSVAARLATGLPSSPSSYQWDPSDVPYEDGGTPIDYRIRVTATDTSGPNVRSDDSDSSFTIAPPAAPTTLGWADVKPIFETYCTHCHGQPARTMALEYFRLDKYNADDPVAPINSDVGVYEQRDLVYQRLVVQGSMPPASEPQPSASEVDKVRDWILGGAPQ